VQVAACSFCRLVAAIQIGDGIGDVGQHDQHLLDDRTENEINDSEDTAQNHSQSPVAVSGECRDQTRENENHADSKFSRGDRMKNIAPALASD